jgi:myo-inositol-1-phosphate synthase
MSLNDPARNDINIAIIGVGNCASSLVQGLAYYQNGGANEQIGLMHWDLGGYRPKDIKVVAAWDIDRRKVGRDVARAIFEKPNCTTVFCDHVPESGVTVEMGRTLDGFSEHMADMRDDRTFLPADAAEPDRADIVRRCGDRDRRPLELPARSAARRRPNSTPNARSRRASPSSTTSRSSSPATTPGRALPRSRRADHRRRHQGAARRHHRPPGADRPLRQARRQARADLPAQHRRQHRLPQHVEPKRLASKKISKTEAVQSVAEHRLDDENIHVGPSDYVAWQNDNKVCFLRMEGRCSAACP